jgi:hypothetical protein
MESTLLDKLTKDVMIQVTRHTDINEIQTEIVRTYIRSALIEAHYEGKQSGIKTLSNALKEQNNG